MYTKAAGGARFFCLFSYNARYWLFLKNKIVTFILAPIANLLCSIRCYVRVLCTVTSRSRYISNNLYIFCLWKKNLNGNLLIRGANFTIDDTHVHKT